MATPYSKLYYPTRDLISKFKPALTNTFDVYIQRDFGGVSNGDVNFMAYEAVLPGTSYELGQVYGDRMGRTEQYATKRIYPPVDVSFYIDKDYKIMRFFEGWMNEISRNWGEVNDSYVRHNYPDSYRCDVAITKFERDFRSQGQRLVKDGVYGPPKSSIRYTLRRAFPSNLISIPVSYDGASILKTTVTFQYDVYNFSPFGDNFTQETGSGTGTVADPTGGSDNPSQPLSNPEQRASWRYTEEELARFQGNAAIESISQSPKAKQILSGTAISGTANRIGAESLSRSEGSPPLPPTN